MATRSRVTPLLVIAITVGACGGSSATDTRPAPAKVPDATLENTYWRLLTLGDRPAHVVGNIAEPHFVLHPGERRATGSTGCNQFSGSYASDRRSLRFGSLVTTQRACAGSELNAQER